jgi:ABC-type transport system involved in multi-copper enzyme maturation permease subunit
MNARMVKAEVLKLTKRRSLMAWAVLLTSGAMALVFAVLAIRHAVDPKHYGPGGGVNNFDNASFFLANIGSAVAVLIGSMAGAADVGAGVFRDLVATGRSRLALFQVRYVGALIVLVPVIVAAVVVTGVCASMFAGSTAAPSFTLVLQSGGWILVTSCTMLLIAVGLSSLIGSRAQSVTVLLAFQLLVSRILLGSTFLGHLRDVIPLAAMQHFAPASALGGTRGSYATASAVAAVAVLVGWAGAALAAGAWRTKTQDA